MYMIYCLVKAIYNMHGDIKLISIAMINKIILILINIMIK